MKTSEEVVAEIVKDLPEMAERKEELVVFMDKVQKLNGALMKAQGHHDRKEVVRQIQRVVREMGENSKGESQVVRNEALNRIFDYVEGVVGDD